MEQERIIESLSAVKATLAGQIMHIDVLIGALSKRPEPVQPQCTHPSSEDIGEMGKPFLRQCRICGEEFNRVPQDRG